MLSFAKFWKIIPPVAPGEVELCDDCDSLKYQRSQVAQAGWENTERPGSDRYSSARYVVGTNGRCYLYEEERVWNKLGGRTPQEYLTQIMRAGMLMVPQRSMLDVESCDGAYATSAVIDVLNVSQQSSLHFQCCKRWCNLCTQNGQPGGAEPENTNWYEAIGL